MARTARPSPCPWCGAKAQVQPELGGVGWRVVCSGPFFGYAPCRAMGPIRFDCLRAADAWNGMVNQIPQPATVAG